MFGHSSFLPSLSTACTTNEVDILGDNSALALYQLNWDGSDLSGNYNGTSTALAFGNGKFNDGGIFNGTSSKVVLPVGLGDNGDRTRSMWIKVGELPSSGSDFFFYIGNQGVNDDYETLKVNSSGNIQLQERNNAGGSGDLTLTSSITLNVGQWYHIAYVFSGTSRKLYINNSTINGATGTKSGGTVDNSSFASSLGQFRTLTPSYNGDIDQVRIFNKAVTASEVTTLYEEVLCDLPGTTDTTNYPTGTTNTAYYKLDGNATDVTGTYDGTATSMNWTQGRFGSAGSFNGSSSFIDTNAKIPASLDFSVSFWIKSSDTSSGSHFIFSAKGSYTTNGWFIENSGGYLVYGEGNGVGNATSQTSPSIIADGIWNHVVVTREAGGTVNMYINNSRVITDGSVGTYFMTSSTWAYDTHIGRYSLNSQLFYNGDLDQIRIYSSVLTAANVTDLYNEVESVPATTDNFGTVLYTGTGAFQTIAGLNFSPGLTWIKNRVNGGFEHCLFDSVRGAGTSHVLSSDTTGAEGWTASAPMTSFTSNGFAVGVRSDGNANILVNKSGENNVAWNWKAGGPVIANTDGTIASQVSANVDAGFSIVSYTGNLTSTTSATAQSVGHGLGAPPDLIITKAINGSHYWPVRSSVLSDMSQTLVLNTSVSAIDYTATYPIGSSTNDVFYTNWLNSLNVSGQNIIAYCWRSISGYSKIGTYPGTGSNGNQITGLGFQPNWIMIKRTDSADNWNIVDSVRGVGNALFPDITSVELSNGGAVGFDVDGFTINGASGGYNNGSGTYLYMAFK